MKVPIKVILPVNPVAQCDAPRVSDHVMMDKALVLPYLPRLNMAETQQPSTTPAPDGPTNHSPAWGDLVNDFGNGGLTPAQYGAFGQLLPLTPRGLATVLIASEPALAGTFLIVLGLTTFLAVYSTRRANAIEAESAMAAIGRWKDAERDIVKSVPEPPRLHKLSGGGGGGGGAGGKKGGVLAHMRRYSEEGKRRMAGNGDHHPLNTRRGRERARSRSVDKGRHGMF